MARGYLTRTDVLTFTADGRPLDAIYDEFVATLDIYNKSRAPLTALLTTTTTDPSEIVPQTGELAEFESASEFGAAKSIRTGPTPLLLGTPLDWYDTAIRYTESFLRDATAKQVETLHAAAFEADNRLLFKKTMRALLTKTTLGDRLVNDAGVSIYSLWDGSSDATPPSFGGKTFSAGHSHYLASGAATVDGDDLATLIDHVTEHGYGVNAGEQVVLLAHPNDAKVIRGFRVASGSPYDFIPAEGAAAYLSTETVIGSRAPSEFRNLKVIGSYGEALIVESYNVPDKYVICVAAASGGRTALSIRVHPRADYQGLRLLPNEGRVGPYLLNATYANGYGVAVRNRGAAAVMQITTGSTYTNPSI